ncbi:MAG: PAS domain-containing hybrid sensor histidine kinase/response regulator [Candidatus Limnocylindrales bacterium]
MPESVQPPQPEPALAARILEAFRDAVIAVNGAGAVTYWNAGAERLLGVSAGVAIGRAILDLVPESGLRGHEPLFQAVRCGATWEGDIRLSMPGRERQIIEVLAYPVPEEAERPGSLLLLWDVTENRAGLDASLLLATIVEQADDAIYAVNQESRVLSWNRGAERLTGFTAEEIIGGRSPLVVPTREERNLTRQKVLGGETIRVDDAAMRCKDGTLILVSYMASPVPGRAGEPHALSVIARDDRPRRAAEHELRLREVIVDAMSDAVVAVDSDGRIVLWGAGAERLVGIPAAEALGCRLRELVGYRLRDMTMEQALAIVESAGVFRGDVDITVNPGRQVIGEATLSSVVDAEKRRLVVAVVRDVSAERASAETASRLAAIVESADDMIVASNVDGVLTSWNTGATRLLGWEPGEIIGRTVAAFLAPESVADVWAHRTRVLAGATSAVHGELTAITKSGAQIPVWGSLAPIRDAAGTAVGISMVARDLRQRKNLEEQLRQSHKLGAVGRLADGLAHDFNNVLTAVTGYAGLIETAVPPNDPIAEDARQIVRATGRAAELTRSLLAFSRGKPLEPQVVSLDAVLEDLVPMLRRLLPERVELRTDLASGAALRADPAELELILVNLALNASDAMPDGGRLSVETALVALDERFASEHLGVAPGRYGQLVVSDSGVGMTEEVRGHIFEPFFTTKGGGAGTGVGLATVHATVDRAGGTIWVTSAPGEGASFRILFPAVSAPVPALDEAPALLPAGGTERILLVEDDVLVRALATAVLRRAGYALTVRSDPRDALDLEPSSFDMLVTDVVMPGLGGPALASKLRDRRPDLRVVFMTGFAERDAADQVAQLTAEPLLLKPFTPVALMTAVRQALDRGAGAAI